MGRLRSLKIASFLMLFCVSVLTLMCFLEESFEVFYGVSLFCRFLFGIGYTTVFIVGFATIASNYGENSGKYNGYGEACCGFGLFCGPVVGGLIYKFSGFIGSQALLTFFFFLSILCVFFYYPKDKE